MIKNKCLFKNVVSLAIANSKPLSEAIEEDCNDFLKSHKGLSYLIMKYPTLSCEQAIKEYKSGAYLATNF